MISGTDFNNAAGVFPQGTPPGTYTFTYTVTGICGVVSTDVDVEVVNPPNAGTIVVPQLCVGSPSSLITTGATPIAGNIIGAFTLLPVTGNPSFLTFTDNGDSTATIEPGPGSAGTYDLVYVTSDTSTLPDICESVTSVSFEITNDLDVGTGTVLTLCGPHS